MELIYENYLLQSKNLVDVHMSFYTLPAFLKAGLYIESVSSHSCIYLKCDEQLCLHLRLHPWQLFFYCLSDILLVLVSSFSVHEEFLLPLYQL